MSNSACSQPSKEPQFCCVRKKGSCECGNNYRDVVKKGPWNEQRFPLWINFKKNPRAIWLGFQAHHIDCVSAVKSEIFKNPLISGIVRETVWCINNKNNMIAMPMLAHTISWYVYSEPVYGELVAPPFKNICQHDVDHNGDLSYMTEIVAELKQLAHDVQEAKHDCNPVDLADELNDMSDWFRDKLTARAQRKGGTHQAWLSGISQPNGDWYQPFSMAKTAYTTEKTFPFDDKKKAWIDRFIKAIGGA